jgi:hypothetical protein
MVDSVFEEEDTTKYFLAIQKLSLSPKSNLYHIVGQSIYIGNECIPVKNFSTSWHAFRILTSQ